MYEIVEDIQRWFEAGERVVLATVVSTWGSSPRIPGAKMAFTPSGSVSGSVSGGCVESAVIEAGLAALAGSRPALLHYGVSDETALDVGLACGGAIDVFVQELDPSLYEAMRALLNIHEPVVLARVIRGAEDLTGKGAACREGGVFWSNLPAALEQTAMQAARTAFDTAAMQNVVVEFQGQSVELLADPILPPQAIVMVGGAHISVALANLAKAAGFQTVVIDPRRVFGSPERFPGVDQLIPAWPQEAFRQVRLDRQTAVVMLTHDPKIDDPALEIVLNSPVFYVGALGSRKTQEARRGRLLGMGFTPEQVERIHGPVGLDIGARLPEEIAVSILAEIIAVSRVRRE